MGTNNKDRRKQKKRKAARDVRLKTRPPLAGQIKELLPKLHSSGIAPGQPVWNSRIDFSDEDSIPPLLDLLEIIQDVAQRDSVEALAGVSHMASEDLHRLMPLAGDSRQRRLLSFIHFWLAIHPIVLGIGSGMLQYAHVWIEVSLAKEDPNDTSQFFEFLKLRNPHLLSIAEDCIEEWTRCYFYYSRVRGVMAELGHTIFEPLYGWLSRRFPRHNAVLAAAQMLPWAERHLPAWPPSIAKDFERLLTETTSTPRHVRKDIGIALSTHAGYLTDVPPSKRAAWVLSEFQDLLEAHEPLQILVASLGSDPQTYIRAREEMLWAIRQHCKFIRNRLGGRPEWADIYGRSRFFHIFSPSLLPLLENGLCALTHEFLAALRGQEKDLRRTPPLFISALHPRGTLYAVEERSSLPGSTTPVDITPLAKATNEALGTFIVNTSDPDFPLHKPERLGVPNREAAARFESLLTTHLELPRIGALLGAGGGPAKHLVLVPGLQLPIQSLMLKNLGWTLPWESNPAQPLPDRPLRRALLWASGTFTSDLERDEVRRVLERIGLQVDIVAELEMSTERFRQFYTQDAYDVLWVAVHGQYSHDSPHEAHLILKEGESLSLQELAELKVPENGRRLLVLNVCDGATTATLGDMPELGLAAVATKPTQALISHLWPVEPLIAAIFGVLLALGLERTGKFFGAFEWACRAMQSGQKGILERLTEGHVLELSDRLRHREGAFDNLLDWGSAAFFD